MNKFKYLLRVWWVKWALVTAIGWAIVMPLNEYLGSYDWYDDSWYLLVPILLAAVGQGILLRNQVKGAIWWALITALGHFWSLLSFISANGFFDIQYLGFGLMFVPGLVLGGITYIVPALLQFVFIYNNKIPKSGWWILVGILSFSVSTTLYVYYAEGQAMEIFNLLIGGILIGATSGIPTGKFMQYLLDNAKAQSAMSDPNQS